MVLVDFENRHKSKQSTSNRSQTDTQLGDNIPDKLKDWWSPICSVDQLEMSNKMLMLSTILSECEMRNEKLVVFSGCLSTLNVIEHFLKKISEANRNLKASSTDYKGVWKRDLDYSRLDGSQSAETRKRDVTRFNRENNTRTRWLQRTKFPFYVAFLNIFLGQILFFSDYFWSRRKPEAWA